MPTGIYKRTESAKLAISIGLKKWYSGNVAIREGRRRVASIECKKKRGANGRFTGGEFANSLAKILLPLGYVQEYLVKYSHLRGHEYHLDFALTSRKIAIECDGPSHRARTVRASDSVRDKRLRKLGWKVIRVPHD